MRSLYEPPWNNGHSYEPEVEAEKPPYIWRGARILFSIIVGCGALFFGGVLTLCL